ncbi:putative signal-transduction protein with CBS domains [Pyrobaculum neutrophilum V24Sta]|uniref:Signal-transduction protein with CBS domains n=2 Tax=Pyrobaculum neutrophilum TaxID=70771 RepID=B1YBX9_PYRNV|nr:putative signal-transduction protein with CBS domains [Pyrobaculum neutrophilum V24Sta]
MFPMKAGDIARKPPVTVAQTASIREAAKLMAEARVGLVVVVDPGDPGRILGVVSERDVIRAVASGLDLSRPVRDVMSSPVVAVDAEEPVQNAARAMRNHNVRHVVVTRGGRLYGVISIRDLIAEQDVLKSLVEAAEPVENLPAAD